MSDSYDPMWSDTENDAANTKCETCGDSYEVVRPGKIQPSCPCEYIKRLEDENALLRMRPAHAGPAIARLVDAARKVERNALIQEGLLTVPDHIVRELSQALARLDAEPVEIKPGEPCNCDECWAKRYARMKLPAAPSAGEV